MAQAQQASLASSLAANFNENFKNQSDILGKLNAMWTPIAAAGPVQTGMGAAELAALTTGATEGVAQEYAKAGQALRTTLAARGGGQEFLPSGARESLESSLASAAASEAARQKQAITLQNYNLGRQNWLAATAGLHQLASQYNPLGFAGAAQQGFSSSFDMANKIAQQRSQKQAMLGGLIGSGLMDLATFGAGGLANLGAGETFGEGVGDFFKGGLNALTGQG
ncbi:MAG TPA: hypothetical protein VFA52_04590 [Candidatus Paceibacterota bacterium]|jgi:hypothetical protein|nr:hypothetical protein [Candidatus Paceibacterota bacterium]